MLQTDVSKKNVLIIQLLICFQKMKSEVAAKSAKAMNPYLNITAHQNRVGPDTESILQNIIYLFIIMNIYLLKQIGPT